MKARAVIRAGDPAPDFLMPGFDPVTEVRRDFALADYRGQPVVLVFYPGDDTPVCTKQISTYSTQIDRFRAVDAQVLAISPQSVDSHVRFACGHGGFAFPLLSDGDKKVAERYGILGPLGFYRRSVFVVDDGGVVRFARRTAVSLTISKVDDIIDAVNAATGSDRRP